MNLRTSKSVVVFASTAVALGLLTSCGETTTFTEKRADHRFANGEAQIVQSADAVAAAAVKSVPNGEDSTKGDKEPTDEQNVAPPAPSNADTPVNSQANRDADTRGADQVAIQPEPANQSSVDYPVMIPGVDGLYIRPGVDGAYLPPPGSDGVASLPKKKTREMSFAAQSIAEGSVTKILANASLTSEIKLVRATFDRVKKVTQITRAQAIDQLEQGNSGATEVQTFNQIVNRPLDIVLVIDDSGSMAEEQQNMASKLTPLLSFVQDADWQIGVVTTDPNEGCLRRLIKKGDADAAQLFAAAVTAGTRGSGNERGVLQAVKGLAGTCLAKPWTRPDSTVAVLIVSDEDNCSKNGSDCPGKDYASANYLYDYLASIREPGKNARVYGLIWHPSQSQAQCSTGANKGTIYADLIARTTGTWGSICSADYSPTLSQMSKDIMVVLNSKFTLTYVPEPNTVRVFVDDVERTSGVTITGKVVELTPAPGPGTKIKVSYRHDATPINTSFALRYMPDAALLSVEVDGQAVLPSFYSVSETNKLVTFNSAPAEYAKIVVTYTRADQPLDTVFTLGEPVKGSTVGVKVNGVPVQAFTVAEASGNIKLNSPPPDGAAIEISYKAIGDPVLKYPFTPSYDRPLQLEAYDAETGMDVGMTYENSVVTIDANEFAEGRRLVLRYDNVSRQRFDVLLPAPPLPGLVAKGGAVVCVDAAHFSVNDLSVKVDGCQFTNDVTQVQVDYSYILENRREFNFAVDKLPSEFEWQEWTVTVNGAARTDYTRQGNKIVFADLLPLGAVVKIQLTQYDL